MYSMTNWQSTFVGICPEPLYQEVVLAANSSLLHLFLGITICNKKPLGNFLEICCSFRITAQSQWYDISSCSEVSQDSDRDCIISDDM